MVSNLYNKPKLFQVFWNGVLILMVLMCYLCYLCCEKVIFWWRVCWVLLGCLWLVLFHLNCFTACYFVCFLLWLNLFSTAWVDRTGYIQQCVPSTRPGNWEDSCSEEGAVWQFWARECSVYGTRNFDSTQAWPSKHYKTWGLNYFQIIV